MVETATTATTIWAINFVIITIKVIKRSPKIWKAWKWGDGAEAAAHRWSHSSYGRIHLLLLNTHTHTLPLPYFLLQTILSAYGAGFDKHLSLCISLSHFVFHSLINWVNNKSKKTLSLIYKIIFLICEIIFFITLL